MKTGNFSRASVEQFDIIKDYNLGETWLISITDPKSNPVYFRSDYKRILPLEFHDIHKLEHGYIRFNETHLSLLNNFITTAKEHKVNLLAHCEAGICRSGAVISTLLLLGWSLLPNINERIPNTFVFKNLRRSFGFEYIGEQNDS
jgi:predicted protein tyrosine phosphatase